MNQPGIIAPDRSRHRGVLTVAVACWFAAVAAGSFALMAYANAPGRPCSPPEQWPAPAGVTYATERPRLLMFVHPHCPCSRASISELALLMARAGRAVDAHVLFLQPPATDRAWMLTDTWRAASAIPGVTVEADPGGQQARLFRCETSGTCVLYDRAGHLIFRGGITIARGHAGDNPGRDAIEALLFHQPALLTNTPAFGCSLVDCPAPL
jgi:hypothetical protein